MTDHDDNELQSLLKQLWGKLMINGRYDAAISVGVLSLLIAGDKSGDTELYEGGVAFILKAIEEITTTMPGKKASSDIACSFCGKFQPEVKLILGASAQICNECVALAAEVFQKTE